MSASPGHEGQDEAGPAQQDTSDGASSRISPPPDENRIVRHIMVIGFHHKHGYQVDYCYPPLTPDGPVFTTPARPITLPSCWKTLPLLCLPDGSHNFNSDAIYFTMPDVGTDGEEEEGGEGGNRGSAATPAIARRTTSNENGIKTIFGTACYRQIQVEKLLNRTDDMTRVAVQKSVCVLSTQPLFGLIRSKLEMITHAYFEELDFSKVCILKLTYDNLNSLLARDSVRENATFLGLSARNLVAQFGNNVLVLYKAMMLEKKILFYKSPVRDLCSTIMSMCSLFNGLLECGGLNHSTCHLQLSPTLLEALKLEPQTPKPGSEGPGGGGREGKVFFSPAKNEVTIELSGDETFSADELAESAPSNADNNDDKMTDLKSVIRNVEEASDSTGDFESIGNSPGALGRASGKLTARKVADGDEDEEDEEEEGANADISTVTSNEETSIDDPYAHKLCQLKPEDCGLPLQIFTRGSFCLPYLSISYLDLLGDKRVRSFVIGATNFLFKQRREMYDVIVDMEENSIQISDTNLKKNLSLTIEDLRFMDYISRHANPPADTAARVDGASQADGRQTESLFDPINHEVTKWLGGDEWIRYHFKVYTLYLLKAARGQSGAVDSFNRGFVQAWKCATNNYRIWEATGKWAILNDLQPRHPFSSAARGINFSDMKLKLSYAVSSSERGRLVNQTLNEIGKWSIWNNLASAGNMAATTVSSIATSASGAASAAMSANAAASAGSERRSPPADGLTHADDKAADDSDQATCR